MRNLETGNLGMEIENDSTDEIGDLINGYNSMTKRLDATINEVYRSKIKEKEYEMRAVQAQINPHFLYNSLSIIRGRPGGYQPYHVVVVHLLPDSVK